MENNALYVAMSTNPADLSRLGSKLIGTVILLAGAFLWTSSVWAETYQEGETVLGECGEIFQRGTIKAIKKGGYVLNFKPEEARPLICVPYLWKEEFLRPYRPAKVFAIKGHRGFLWIREGHPDMKFEVGEEVGFDYQVERRGPNATYKLTGVIKDLTQDGLISLRVIGGDPKGREEFEKRVGNNYLSLESHSMFHGEKIRRLGVEK